MQSGFSQQAMADIEPMNMGLASDRSGSHCMGSFFLDGQTIHANIAGIIKKKVVG